MRVRERSTLSVLFVHNRYQVRGGEDAVFEAESELLEQRGHRVEHLVFDNHDLPAERSLLADARLAVETVWSRRAQKRLRLAIDGFQPDVVHFHNTLPLVSPAAYSVAKAAGAAVVQSLHNFRMVCPNGLLYRDGQACEACIDSSIGWRGVLHGCYRGSRQQTATVVAMQTLHRLRGTWQKDVDLYLTPSQFLKSKVMHGGLRDQQIIVKPHFLASDPGAGDGAGGYALFAGRLNESKGIGTLLQAYRSTPDGLPPLRIAGDGALADLVREAVATDPRITWLGFLPHDDVLAEMLGARVVVVPSLGHETFGMTVLEAYARGVPVVASSVGALPELVVDGCSGFLFSPGDVAEVTAKLSLFGADSRPDMRLRRTPGVRGEVQRRPRLRAAHLCVRARRSETNNVEQRYLKRRISSPSRRKDSSDP